MVSQRIKADSLDQIARQQWLYSGRLGTWDPDVGLCGVCKEEVKPFLI